MITMASNSQTNHISAQAAAEFWQATLQRDPRAEGKFFFAVRSTHIYCRPTCPARRPLRSNTVFFRTMQEAEKNGYRPCRRCRPQEQLESVSLVQRAAELLGDSNEEGSIGLEGIARKLHITTPKLRRAFHRMTGLSPREFAHAARLERFKKLLREGAGITDALYACGYGSSSRIYEKTNSQLGMTPASYRKGGLGMQITFTVVASSLGKVLVAGTERGISAVYLGDDERLLLRALQNEYPRAQISHAATSNSNWLKEILSRVEGHPPNADLPLDVQATAFQRRVWQELQKIPLGSTRTYTQVAKALGKPNSVRAVARACATNPTSVVVPCHRVIRADGALAGYRWGLQRKEKLLEREAAFA